MKLSKLLGELSKQLYEFVPIENVLLIDYLNDTCIRRPQHSEVAAGTAPGNLLFFFHSLWCATHLILGWKAAKKKNRGLPWIAKALSTSLPQHHERLQPTYFINK